jgi:hypothetical protein
MAKEPLPNSWLWVSVAVGSEAFLGWMKSVGSLDEECRLLLKIKCVNPKNFLCVSTHSGENHPNVTGLPIRAGR